MAVTSMSVIEKTCEAQPTETVSTSRTVLFATTVGVIVTNVFAPQTLIGVIGPSLGFAPAHGGLIPTATLLGYALGLFLLVPLADLIENRRLVVTMLIVATISAGAAALAASPPILLALLLVLGAASSAIQILVPLIASMTPPQQRGRVIGDVMGGLMFGILLSRPLASAIADAFGWRAFYVASALAMTLLTIVLYGRLPRHQPSARSDYLGLIASLWHLLRTEPALRLRALTAAMVMAAFSVFWTTIALRLAEPPFSLSQRGIALFALAGAGGALVTPFAGRAGDRGWTRPVTIASHITVIGAFALAAWAGAALSGSIVPLAVLGLGAVVLDIGVTGDQTLGRRVINLLRPDARGRINGLFVGLFFLGGAIGSSAAGLAWASGGWLPVCAFGGIFSGLALIIHWIAGPP
jgi:predicted MFS family arabinose efflux permease